MKVYITRHGQVLPPRYYGDAMFPCGDPPLTPLGRQQAEFLGAHLSELGFSGKIFASPFRRTMETATIVAQTLGGRVIPLPCLREIFKTREAAETFLGMTAKELAREYPRADTTFWKDPWWEKREDTYEDVVSRVFSGMDALFPLLRQEGEDILLVGHGASVSALRSYFKAELYCSVPFYNCGLTVKDLETEESYCHDASFIPPECRTNNQETYLGKRAEWEEVFQRVVAEAAKYTTHKILHLGDTFSFHREYYARMVEALSPDVILHTGDLADECKAGRLASHRALWEERVPKLLDMLRESGAKVGLVPGNNDPEDLLQKVAADLEIFPQKTVLSLCGKTFFLCHQVQHLQDAGADFYLYGHGLRGEGRSPETCREGEKVYWNASWGSALILPEEGVLLPLPLVAF